MHYHQSLALGIEVPAFLLHVLQNVVLVMMPRVIHDVNVTIVFKRFHARHLHVFRQFYRFHPSAEHTLVSGIVARSVSVVVIAAIIHQRPTVHAEVRSVGASVVEVGQTKAVCELMAHRAQPVYLAAAVQLRTAGVGVYVHSVDVEVGIGFR